MSDATPLADHARTILERLWIPVTNATLAAFFAGAAWQQARRMRREAARGAR